MVPGAVEAPAPDANEEAEGGADELEGCVGRIVVGCGGVCEAIDEATDDDVGVDERPPSNDDAPASPPLSVIVASPGTAVAPLSLASEDFGVEKDALAASSAVKNASLAEAIRWRRLASNLTSSCGG